MILDFFKRKPDKLDPSDKEALSQAMLQRSKMDMVFDPQFTALTGLSCALNTIRDNSLVFDLYGLDKFDSFSGKPVQCHFRIREGKSGVGFYMIHVIVQDVIRGKHGGMLFTTSLPDKVERSQRRRSLRMRPELAWFEEIRIWAGELPDDPGDIPPDITLASFSWAKPCRIDNISAGGLGLFIPNVFCTERGLCPAKGAVFTLFLAFAAQVRGQPQHVWLKGKVVRLEEDLYSKDMSIGLCFEHVGHRRDQESIRWAEVHDNVTAELADRFFDWHMALNRQRGVRAD